MPSSSSLERMALPMNPDDGPDQTHLLAMLELLLRLHEEDSTRGVMIETPEDGDVTVMVGPIAVKFDGTTVAGGLHQHGTGDQAKLIGSTEEITLRTVLEWMGSSNHCDEDVDDDDSSGSDGDEPDLRDLDRHINRLAAKLIRSIDAYHLQSLTVPVFIQYANYGHTLASAVKEVVAGQSVEARFQESQRYHAATVITAHDDGSADLQYHRADQVCCALRSLSVSRSNF